LTEKRGVIEDKGVGSEHTSMGQ